jgi:hypothetical protein
MTRAHLCFAALIVAAVWQGGRLWQSRPLHPPDGAIASADPAQTAADSTPEISAGRWRLTPRARYDVTARILGREDYRFDALADLIPEDLALGWGPMSDNRVLSALEITQGGRFYAWRPLGNLPIPRAAVVEHSANTHVIPASSMVRERIRRLRVGEVVRFRGLLVDARRDDGASIRTSLTRKDSGAGACEVLYVEEVETL